MVMKDLCENCTGKTTTIQCINCTTYKLKNAIKQLDEFIEAHKSNLTQYILYINNLYADILKNSLDYNLIPNLEIRYISLLTDKEVCIIVDKKLFDWGDINVDYKYIEINESEENENE